MRNKIIIFLPMLILAFVYWQWWLPGPRVASDFSFISDLTLKSYIDLPRIWSDFGAEGLGEYSVFTLWAWPVNFILGFFSNLGFNFNLLERVFFIVPILGIGIFGLWKLCQTIKLSNQAKALSIIFYLTNTYILLLIDGGQLSIALAYSFLPFCFLYVKKGIKSGLKINFFSGLLVSVLGFFDIRFIFILFLLTLIYFLYEFLFLDKKEKIAWFIRGLRSGIIIGLLVLGIHAYWLLPIIKVPLSSQIYQQLINTSPGGFTNIGHALTLLSPNWFKNVFGITTSIKWEFILIPFLVFLAPILKPKSKIIGFWLIVAILSIFLTKGTNPPLSNIYSWLFTNITPFSLFRDSTKFFFLVALSYSILIGITFDEISKRIKNTTICKLFFFLEILYIVSLAGPVWQGNMNGALSSPPMQKDYYQLREILQEDDKFSRIFWIPSVPPLGYSSPMHPWVEAARLYQRRPFASEVRGTYELFNFLRESPYMGQIFDISGIGFIGYPYPDERRDSHPDNVKYYYTFFKQLSKLPWLTKVNESNVPLWKIKTHQDKFFVTPNLWWVIGPDDIYKESTTAAKLSLSKNAMVFVEEKMGLGKQIDKLDNAKITLNHKTIIDLAATFIEPKDLIFPSYQLKESPDQSGWWKREPKDLINFRDFLITKYQIDNKDFDLGGGWIVGEGNLELKIKNDAFKSNKILLARVLESTRSGKLDFYQDELVGQIDTKNEGDNIRWFEVGNLPKDKEDIIIQANGEINIINALAIVDKSNWEIYKNKSLTLSNEGRILNFDEKNATEGSAEVFYKKINSTKYLVKVKNLSNPAFLVFSETFHPLWKLNTESSLPVYNLMNGFKLERDGEYLVEFEPQRFVYEGLIISVITLIFALFLLIR